MQNLDALRTSDDPVLAAIGSALSIDDFIDWKEEEVVRSVEALRACTSQLTEPISHVEYAGVGIKGKNYRKTGESMLVDPQDVANIWSTPEDFGRYLYRLCRLLRPSRVVEIGTCIGISGLYILYGSSHGGHEVRFATLEGSPQLAEAARRNFDQHGYPDADIRQGVHGEILPQVLQDLRPIEFAYVDGSHLYREVLDQHGKLLAAASDSAVIFHDDIGWSAGMKRAWRKMLEAQEDVMAAVDLIRAGIVVVRRGYRGPPRVFEPFK